MSITDPLRFWDDDLAQEAIDITDGSVVVYRGNTVEMHFEQPTVDIMQMFTRAQAFGRVLIGPRHQFPEEGPEIGDLITVDGDDWRVADFFTSRDGEDIYMALTRSTRL